MFPGNFAPGWQPQQQAGGWQAPPQNFYQAPPITSGPYGIAPPKPLVAADHQVDHIERVKDILSRHYFYFDTSPTGEGKTECALIVARDLGLKIAVLCPASVQQVWLKRAHRYGLSIIFIRSYETLRMKSASELTISNAKPSKKRSQAEIDMKNAIARQNRVTEGAYTDGYKPAANPYFIRYEMVRQKTSEEKLRKGRADKIEFYNPKSYYVPYFEDGSPSPKLDELIEAGTLFCFDEAQKLKNNTSTMRAVAAFSKMIYRSNNLISRIAFLSASPFDKPKHTINLFEVIGVLTAEKLSEFNPGTKEMKYLGYKEIADYCHTLDPVTADAEINRLTRNTRAASGLAEDKYVISCFVLWIAIIRKFHYSRMKPRRRDGIVLNGYCNIPDDTIKEAVMKNMIKILSIILQEKDKGSSRAFGNQGFNTELIIAMMQREKIRTPALIWAVRNVLDTPIKNGPDGQPIIPKVAVCAKYIRDGQDRPMAFADLAYYLQDYNPLFIWGKDGGSGSDEREYTMDLFNNDPTRRLLICQMDATAVGVSLHDQDGHFPRHIFGISDYAIITMHQFEGRFDRFGGKSKPIFHWIYYNLQMEADTIEPNGTRVVQTVKEGKIIDMLQRKSVTLHAAVGDAKVEDIIDIETGELKVAQDSEIKKIEDQEEAEDEEDELTMDEIKFQDIKFPGDHVETVLEIFYPPDYAKWQQEFITSHPSSPIDDKLKFKPDPYGRDFYYLPTFINHFMGGADDEKLKLEDLKNVLLGIGGGKVGKVGKKEAAPKAPGAGRGRGRPPKMGAAQPPFNLNLNPYAPQPGIGAPYAMGAGGGVPYAMGTGAPHAWAGNPY